MLLFLKYVFYFLGQRVPSLKCAMNILSPVNVGPVRDPLVNIWEDKVKKLKADLNRMMAAKTEED